MKLKHRIILFLVSIYNWAFGPEIILDECPKNYEKFNKENVHW